MGKNWKELTDDEWYKLTGDEMNKIWWTNNSCWRTPLEKNIVVILLCGL